MPHIHACGQVDEVKAAKELVLCCGLPERQAEV
jgi:hypothetical protein